jgi:hypothetical protein
MSSTEAADGTPESWLAARTGPTFPLRARVLIVDDLVDNRLMLGICCDQFGLFHVRAQPPNSLINTRLAT